jgi:hypothetical protein
VSRQPVRDNPSNDLGCLGYLFIAFAVAMVLGGLTALGGGGDTSSWDCPGEQTPCEVDK